MAVPGNPRGRLIPLSALAVEFGWSVSKLYPLVAARRIPHLRIGPRRDVYFERDAIEAWIAARRVEDGTAKRAAAATTRRARMAIEDELAVFGLRPEDAVFS